MDGLETLETFHHKSIRRGSKIIIIQGKGDKIRNRILGLKFGEKVHQTIIMIESKTSEIIGFIARHDRLSLSKT